MKGIKKAWRVEHTSDEQATGLRAFLEDHDIPYAQGWHEHAPHKGEKFVIPNLDYRVVWEVRFELPFNLRTDPAFCVGLSRHVWLDDDEDFEDYQE